MSKPLHRDALVASIAFALAAVGLPAQLDAATTVARANSAEQNSTHHTYIVRFVESGLLHYRGEVSGLAATAVAGNAGGKLDAHSAAATAYKAYLSEQREAHLAAINRTLGITLTPTHSYAVTANAVAVELSASQARQVAGVPGVRSVERARDQRLSTYRGPEFIGAPSIWDGSSVPGAIGTRGFGTVVGVLDTGANSGHPSFADDASCGLGGSNPKQLSAVDCTSSSGGVCNGADPEAADGNGHGVHTGSTAVGNVLTTAAVPPPTLPADAPFMSGVAPCASLRSYKVCATDTCAGGAILAGIENAITDGVDVINFSISGGTEPWDDNDRQFLDALQADIFVAASAGNTRGGSDPVGAVNHLGPWLTSVAASTHDRNVAGNGTLSVTGPGTPSAQLQNIVLTPGSGPNLGTPANGLEIRRYATNISGCTATGGFPSDYFDGSIALIQRGGCNFSEKIQNADDAGAVVAIIYNNTTGAISMNTESATLPAYSILQSQGQAIAAFIDSNAPTPVVTSFSPAVRQGDVLAGFSLRGPSGLVSVTKPDITGPGVSIYAAVDEASGNYGSMSGTSMSSPHLAGAGALLRSAHPQWTPAEVKSALMLTSVTDGHKENLTTAWNADDVGSGRVDLTKAALAGFVMNETYDNFLAANPDTGGDPKTLNISSMRNMNCTDSCEWTRTLRNTLALPSSWTVTVNAPAGLDVAVDRKSFSFDGTAADTQEITIMATPTTDLTAVTFAEVVFKEANGLAPDAHMVVAVKGNAGNEPDDRIFKDGFDVAGTAGFSENFDSYTAGNNLHGQGGWKGWSNDAAAGAIVVNTQSVSTPNSIEIKQASDLVHEFSGYTSGSYTITAMQFIPADYAGESSLVFLNAYSDTDTSVLSWSTQVSFDSATGNVTTLEGAANAGTMPYITGQWVELKLEIDLDQDLQTFYYDGTELYSGSWTQQFPAQDVAGIRNIGAIDLFANNASAVYYDDIRIVPNP